MYKEMMSSNPLPSRYGRGAAQRFSRLYALAICPFMLMLPVYAGQPNAPGLHPGDVFPQFSGQTLTGRFLTLPTTTGDKSTVLVFSFSRKAANDARVWNEHLPRNFPNMPAYGIIMLESVPKLFRGMAVSGMKSGMPLSVQDRMIVSYRDEELWKQRLMVTDNSRAYVLLLGPEGKIHWINSGAFTGAEFARMKSHISGLTKAHPQPNMRGSPG